MSRGARAGHEPTRTSGQSLEHRAMKREMALLMLRRASVLLAKSEFRMTPPQALELIVHCVLQLDADGEWS